MAVTAKPIIDPLQIAAANTTQYTAPVGTRTIIDKFTATNTTAGAQTFTVFLVKAAGAAGAANTIISAKSVAPGETYNCPELVGHVLNTGDFIVTAASAGAAITVRASGREVT